MKSILMTLFLLIFSCLQLWAKDETALYILPAAPEFINHSRFLVTVVEPYKGSDTKKISYIFPKFFMGEDEAIVSLEKVDGDNNKWIGDAYVAHCVENGDYFSCDMITRKEKEEKEADLKMKEEFLVADLRFSPDFIQEPGGLLVHKFK